MGIKTRLCKQMYCYYARIAVAELRFSRKLHTPDLSVLKGPLKDSRGNESPVDVYVNNTGLMWELGKKLGARLVFAEHRCEPSSSLPWCGPRSQACAFVAQGRTCGMRSAKVLVTAPRPKQ